jgi:hypothetical protein
MRQFNNLTLFEQEEEEKMESSILLCLTRTNMFSFLSWFVFDARIFLFFDYTKDTNSLERENKELFSFRKKST